MPIGLTSLRRNGKQLLDLEIKLVGLTFAEASSLLSQNDVKPIKTIDKYRNLLNKLEYLLQQSDITLTEDIVHDIITIKTRLDMSVHMIGSTFLVSIRQQYATLSEKYLYLETMDTKIL
jgi:hypothetical protein